MVQTLFPIDWLTQFTDPYAILGVPVTADERRIQKNHRNIAKVLHPDQAVNANESTEQFATNLLARLVNPAYEKVRQEKGRKEHLALLRLKARQLNREETTLTPKSELAQQLVRSPVSEVEIFYEQAIAQLAASQFNPLEQFAVITEQLSELNLVYLRLKQREVFVAERRTGVIPAPAPAPIPTNTHIRPIPVPTNPKDNYAQRHYKRAQEYAKNGNWSQAEHELRDAIRLESSRSEYHALLGWVYLKKQLPGMARVYIGQALKLNPSDPIALKFAPRLGLQTGTHPASTNIKKSNSNGVVSSQPRKINSPIAELPKNGSNRASKTDRPKRSYVYVSAPSQNSLFASVSAWVGIVKEFFLSLSVRSTKEKSMPSGVHVRQTR